MKQFYTYGTYRLITHILIIKPCFVVLAQGPKMSFELTFKNKSVLWMLRTHNRNLEREKTQLGLIFQILP
jgi:hypothetical protein